MSITFRRNVPLPVPVLTVTVRVAPDPLTVVMMGTPVIPVRVRLKSASSTPVTISENVTVNLTVAALVGLGLARVLDVTVTTGAFANGISAEYTGPGVPVPPKEHAPSLVPPVEESRTVPVQFPVPSSK